MTADPTRRELPGVPPPIPPSVPSPVDDALPPYLVAGNRFGSYGFGTGLTGLLLALAPFGHLMAWFLAVGALVLGLTGFVRYARGSATNRDTSVVGVAAGWIAVVILVAEASIALNLPLGAYSYGP